MPADWKPQQAALPPLAVTTPSSASSNGNTKTDDQETAPKAAFAAYNDKAAALEKVALPRKFLEGCQGVFQSQVSCRDDRCAVSGLTRCIEYLKALRNGFAISRQNLQLPKRKLRKERSPSAEGDTSLLIFLSHLYPWLRNPKVHLGADRTRP